MNKNVAGIRTTAKSISTNEQIVNQYFKSIGKRDVRGLLELFAEDAVVYEPFSKEDGIRGKSAIEYFLRVAVMANAGMCRTIKFVQESDDTLVARVRFERGGSVKGLFSFLFATENVSGQKLIQELKIRFS